MGHALLTFKRQWSKDHFSCMLEFFSCGRILHTMSELPLKALRVFETVARRGSFKDAATELSVTQSAISHQIKHLEDWLGTPLFDRTGHRPQLLAHSQALSTAVRQALEDIDKACQTAKRNTISNDTLVIASIPSVAICWLIPRLSSFQSQYPDITTRVIYAIHGQEIDFNQVDLAFVFASNAPSLPEHTVQLFQPGTSVPVCSPRLYKTLNQDALAESILEAGLLHDANINGWTNWFNQTTLPPQLSITGPVFEDFNLLRAAALADQGVALCPQALISTDLISNRLKQVSDISVHQNFNYYLVNGNTNKSSHCAAKECFSNWVFDMLEEDTLHPSSWQ